MNITTQAPFAEIRPTLIPKGRVGQISDSNDWLPLGKLPTPPPCSLKEVRARPSSGIRNSNCIYL